MKLDFSLLVVDDAPDNVEQAIRILGDHLNTKGFSLKQEVAEDLSNQGIHDLARAQGRNYDLVMVDYNLGQDDRDGAIVAQQLRQELLYVDMVFYSSITVSELLIHLAENEVSGVFAERREDLGDALVGLADTVIGKAVDLNHMRGIAMAEVAEMDVLMAQTLVRVFQSDHEFIGAARDRTIVRLRESVERYGSRLESRISDGGLPAVVRDTLLFSLTSKYQAIKRVAAGLGDEFGDQLAILESYDEDIVQNRNMLAHVMEDSTGHEATTLVSMGRNRRKVVIDEQWMSDFRQTLQTHRAALVTICDALDREFGATTPMSEAEEYQP